MCSYVFLHSSNMFFHIFACILHHLRPGCITNSRSDQLPDGLIARLVEQYTVIAEVIGSNPVKAWTFLVFFSYFNFTTALKVVCITAMINHVFVHNQFNTANQICFKWPLLLSGWGHCFAVPTRDFVLFLILFNCQREYCLVLKKIEVSAIYV